MAAAVAALAAASPAAAAARASGPARSPSSAARCPQAALHIAGARRTTSRSAFLAGRSRQQPAPRAAKMSAQARKAPFIGI